MEMCAIFFFQGDCVCTTCGYPVCTLVCQAGPNHQQVLGFNFILNYHKKLLILARARPRTINLNLLLSWNGLTGWKKHRAKNYVCMRTYYEAELRYFDRNK